MAIIDDLLDEWEERRERGEVVTPESLCADHPELLGEISKQIKALLEVSAQFGSGIFATADVSTSTRFPSELIELPNRYEIVQLHASGGLGNVYLALDRVLDRPVAIKFLKRADLNDEQLARFEWEAKITGQLEHPGIVPIHSMRYSDDATPCYVMRFIDGNTLQKKVEDFHAANANSTWKQKAGSSEFRRLLQSVITVCNIVSFAHARGIVHRDIKPSNIMLGPFGEILLLDWGIAKPIDEEKFNHPMHKLFQTVETSSDELRQLDSIDSPAFTSTGQAIGTPAYASPEQLMGNQSAIGPTSDVFSIGSTLFFILCGKSPVELVGWSTYLNQCKLPYTDLANYLPSQVPKKLQAICRKAIHTRIACRYQTAQELASDIESYLAREPISAVEDSWSERLFRLARKNPAWSGGIVTAGTVLLLGAVIFSLVLNGKNLQLNQQQQSLRLSLAETQKANEQAMTAMRTMFDDVVISHFSEKEELNREDREYLNKSIEQYYAFANRTSNDRLSRSIKAEANYTIARMLHWLSQSAEAIPYAKLSSELYAVLHRESENNDHLQEYLESLRLLSELQAWCGDPEEGIRVGREAIQIVERLCNVEQRIDRISLLDHRSSFLSNITTAYIQNRDWKNAYAHCLLSMKDNEDLYQLTPQELSCINSLASQLSRAAELSIHPELEVSSDERLAHANRSVELRKILLDAEPDIAMSQANWARAHFARALCYADDGNPVQSLEDLEVAIEYVERLRVRYPLIEEWSKQVVEFRTLAARVQHTVGDWPLVIQQIKIARDLRLTVPAMDTFIELLMEYRVQFPDHPLATEWVAELFSRRAALIANMDLAQSLADRREAVKMRRICTADSPLSQAQHKELVRALIELAKTQFASGDTSGAIETVQQARSELEGSELLDDAEQSPFSDEINALSEQIAPPSV